MSRIRIQTVSFNLGSSPASNVMETTRMVQEAADQGWTMRGCYGHQGVLYLIFASKDKGESKPLKGAPELARRVEAEVTRRKGEVVRHDNTIEGCDPLGTRCSVCGLPQFDTPGGPCCANGHGGADPMED